jgi:hypothetical protein
VCFHQGPEGWPEAERLFRASLRVWEATAPGNAEALKRCHNNVAYVTAMRHEEGIKQAKAKAKMKEKNKV